MMMNRQRGTKQTQFGPSAELNVPATGYRVPEGSNTSFASVGSRPLEIARPSRRGRTVMQRNLTKWLDSAQAALGWAVILVILATASGVYLQQVSRTALIGRNAELLGFELTSIRQENNEVRQKITYAQSLDEMQRRSRELGLQYVDPLISAEDYVQVVVPAVDIAPPPVVAPIAKPPKTFGEALTIFLTDYINTLGRGVADGDQ